MLLQGILAQRAISQTCKPAVIRERSFNTGFECIFCIFAERFGDIITFNHILTFPAACPVFVWTVGVS